MFDTMQQNLTAFCDEFPAVTEPISTLSEAISTFLAALNTAHAEHPALSEQPVVAMLAQNVSQLALTAQHEIHKALIAAAMAEAVRKHEAGRMVRTDGKPRLIKSPNAAGPVLRRQR